jgi:aspartate carbamoyltransferase catalytic subunit
MRHLLSINDLTKEGAIAILDTAIEMQRVNEGPVKKLPTLRGKTVVNLFAEDSTRTRISFEAAAKRLSADVINFSAKGSSLSKGESLKDTALTLQALGADAVVIRHPASGAAHQLAQGRWINGAVINAGDGTHEHPSQALLDAYTIRKHLRNNSGDLAGLRVAIVGDVLHSRVARSNILLLTKLGATVVLVAPPTLIPFQAEVWPVEISYDFNLVLPTVDAVIMLRIQQERMTDLYFPRAQEYSSLFGIDAERQAKMAPHAIVMHPGPMNRGLEITAEVADSKQSVVVEQVSNGVAIRMAILYLFISSGQELSQ